MTCVASGGSCAAGGWVFNVHRPHQHGYVARLCRARAGGLGPSMAYQQLQSGWGHSVMHPWALQPSTGAAAVHVAAARLHAWLAQRHGAPCLNVSSLTTTPWCVPNVAAPCGVGLPVGCNVSAATSADPSSAHLRDSGGWVPPVAAGEPLHNASSSPPTPSHASLPSGAVRSEPRRLAAAARRLGPRCGLGCSSSGWVWRQAGAWAGGVTPWAAGPAALAAEAVRSAELCQLHATRKC